MLNFKKISVIASAVMLAISFSSCEDDTVRETINFQNLIMEPNNYWNGSGAEGGLTFGVATFNNTFIEDWDYWEGFSFSNKIDMQTSGLVNQYSAFLSDGGNYQNVYSVAYVWEMSATISFSRPTLPISAKFTNSTWAYLSMLNGDEYGKKFEQDDWFKITIKGYDGSDHETSSIDFYLADFRSEPNYIINSWTNLDLSPLKTVNKIVFYLSSTDNNEWGMNTPAYFCMDDFVVEYDK